MNQQQEMAKIYRALSEGGKHYEIRPLSEHCYHAKCGHLVNNVLLGACAQAFKFDIDVSNPSKF